MTSEFGLIAKVEPEVDTSDAEDAAGTISDAIDSADIGGQVAGSIQSNVERVLRDEVPFYETLKSNIPISGGGSGGATAEPSAGNVPGSMGPDGSLETTNMWLETQTEYIAEILDILEDDETGDLLGGGGGGDGGEGDDGGMGLPFMGAGSLAGTGAVGMGALAGLGPLAVGGVGALANWMGYDVGGTEKQSQRGPNAPGAESSFESGMTRPDWLEDLVPEEPDWVGDLNLDVPEWLEDVSLGVPNFLNGIELGVPDFLEGIELGVPDFLDGIELGVPGFLEGIELGVPDFLEGIELGVPDFMEGGLELEVPGWLKDLYATVTGSEGDEGGGGGESQAPGNRYGRTPGKSGGYVPDNYDGGDANDPGAAPGNRGGRNAGSTEGNAAKASKKGNTTVEVKNEFNLDAESAIRELKQKQREAEDRIRKVEKDLKAHGRGRGVR